MEFTTDYEGYIKARRAAECNQSMDFTRKEFNNLLFHEQKTLITDLRKQAEILQLQKPGWGEW